VLLERFYLPDEYTLSGRPVDQIGLSNQLRKESTAITMSNRQALKELMISEKDQEMNRANI
jgi:hypothetical protein